MNQIRKGLLLQDLKFDLIIPFVIASVFWNSGVSCCLAGQQASGELKLEGEHVERLVLWRMDGHTERFDRPGEVVELPVGQYQLHEAHLDGGYDCLQGGGAQNKWITIAENTPAVLKVGTPLKQILEVKRQGRTLALNYKLLGIGGEAYTRADRNNPPDFTVYKGEQEIASGQLSYG
jgi:hypothetical protein